MTSEQKGFLIYIAILVLISLSVASIILAIRNLQVEHTKLQIEFGRHIRAHRLEGEEDAR